MNKKNLHIKKYLSGKLPEPEVQADDAWSQMNDMFGQTSVPDSQLQNVSKFKYLLKYGLGLLSGVTIVAGSWLLLPESNKVKTAVKSSLEEITQDSIVFNEAPEGAKTSIPESPVTGKDSLIINSKDIQTDHITNSLSNNKVSTNQFTDTKNQSVNSGLIDNSKALIINKKTNSESENLAQNRSIPLVPGSDHFDNRYKKNINKRIVSNKVSENKRTNERSEGLKEKKSRKNTFEKSFDSAENQSSGLKEKNDLPEKINQTKSDDKIIFPVKNLVPKLMLFSHPRKNRIVTIPEKSANKKEENKAAKSQKPLLETLHFGLEWSATSSFKNTKYILSGADSTNRPYLLLIPGLWLRKDLSDQQSITLSFLPYQSYFGGNKLINQKADSIFTATKNTNVIKGVGLNLSLQYNYRFYSKWEISGGVSYSKLRKALFQENLENYQGIIIPVSKVTLKKPDLTNFIQTNSISFKTGISFNPGRYQFGANLVVPITDISATSLSMRTLNGQIFFRFRIK